MKKIGSYLKKEWKDTVLLLRSVPAVPFSLFVLSIVLMNILANKTIVNESWIAIDGGIVVSWLAFMMLDILVRRYGPKASTKIMVTALIINLLAVCIFNLVAVLSFGGGWVQGADAELDALFAGSWHVLAASSVAFLTAAIVSNFLHWAIRKRFKPQTRNKFSAFAVASWTSTLVAQFVDNLLFGLLFLFALGFITLTAAIMMAATGMVAELICQALFSPFGYRVAEKWRKNKIGDEYLVTHSEIKSLTE